MLVPLLLTLVLAELPPASAGLPPFASVNPGQFSHSPLTFQPFALPRDTWSFGANLEYGNAIELWKNPGIYYDFDGEVLRVDLSLVRKVGGDGFVQLKFGVMGVYAGFLDHVIDGYHSLLGIYYPARSHRPKNQFEYVAFDGPGTHIIFEPFALRPLDPELGYGRQFGPHVQLYGALTFPGGAPEGYGRQTVTASVRGTFRYRIGRHVLSESSVGFAWAPPSGPLAHWQNPLLAMGSSGLRLDFGHHAIYGNAMLVSAPAERNGSPFGPIAKLDGALDFGYLHTFSGGQAFWVGLTEDVIPNGPAVDVVVHTGFSWDP